MHQCFHLLLYSKSPNVDGTPEGDREEASEAEEAVHRDVRLVLQLEEARCVRRTEPADYTGRRHR